MKKSLLMILSALCVHVCMAQYYAVNDTDSFVNVREKPGTNATIIAKLPNESIVFASSEDNDEKSNWLYVDFYLPKTKKNKDDGGDALDMMKGFSLHSGYIYKTKLTAIEKIQPLKYKQRSNGYTCFNDSITIKIDIAPYVAAKHTVQYSKINEGVWDKVDKQPMIGSDGTKPREEIKNIIVFINNKPVNIPATAWKNLFNPSWKGDVYADKNGTVYLVMYNSDAAGSYSCIFVFKNGAFIQRLVFDGDC